MLKILKRLKGKSLSDILLKILKEFFIIYSNIFPQEFSKIKLTKNLVLSKKKGNHYLTKLDISSYFNSCDESKVIYWADNIMSHKFNLLGSYNVNVSYENRSFSFEGVSYEMQPNKPIIFCSDNLYKPIDWHCDFKSGYRWDKKIPYNKTRRKSDGLKGVDIKFPWELSRFQHLSVLVKAFQLTKNKQYLEEVILQITDWILNNKSFKGVNWGCTMDVSIRLANWSIALDYIESQYDISKNIKLLFSKSIQKHIKYIMFNLEWTHRLTSNHYLSNISGLYISLLYYDNYKFLKKWSKNQLEKEIIKQTYSDGMNSESSTSYHRLVLELFAFPMLFSKNNFSNSYKNRLEKMFDFIFWIKKNNGSIPMFGDNDSGLFFYYSIGQKHNLNYFDNFYTKLFKKNICPKKYQGIKLFENSGICIYKNKNIHLGITNMPNGQNGNGGHCHNDKLSFELTIDDNLILVDPGTFVYTSFPLYRNQYRSTLSHNTVCVENSEQNRFIKNNLFSFYHDVNRVTNEIYFDSDNVCNFTGTHNGYKREGNDYIHERRFKITNSLITIDDIVISTKKKINCFATFLMPKKYFKRIVDNVVISELLKIEFNSDDISFSEDIYYASEYGELSEPLITIKVNFMNKLKSKILVINN